MLKHLTVRRNSHMDKKKIHEQQIQQLLTTIQINSFHGPARNTMSSLEIKNQELKIKN